MWHNLHLNVANIHMDEEQCFCRINNSTSEKGDNNKFGSAC